MEKITNNYHTHTYRCGHAYGKEEEMIQEAIKNGIKVLGFSEHCIFPNLNQVGIRPNSDELDDYVKTINELKIKYKDQIKIYVGMEAEYYDEYKDWYETLLTKKGIEYLILGQHFDFQDGYFKYYFSKQSQNDEDLRRKEVKNYVDSVIKGIHSGFFKIICHPDFFFVEAGTKYLDEYERIIIEAEKHHLPIEINMGGIRKCFKISDNPPTFKIGENIDNVYPNPKFFELVSKYNVDVIIGGDYHCPNEISYNTDEIAYFIVKKYHLHLIDKIDI